MKTFLKYPLNIQLFAEGGGAGGEGGNPTPTPVPPTTATVEIDYSKVAEAVEKRSAQTGDNVLKGYLKSQGLTGEQLDQAVTSFKQQQLNAANQEKEANKQLKAENEQFKAQILNSKIDAEITTLASAEGVSTEKLPFILKMITREGMADDKGEVIKEKTKEVFDELLKSFPEFKGTTQQQSGFQQIGASGNDGPTQPDASAAAFLNGRIVLPKKQ